MSLFITQPDMLNNMDVYNTSEFFQIEHPFQYEIVAKFRYAQECKFSEGDCFISLPAFIEGMESVTREIKGSRDE